MTDNPELRAKILDWQKRYNIQDGDPAIALLELVDLFGHAPQARPMSSGEGEMVTASVSPESVSEAMKGSLAPFTERVNFQIQELLQKLEHIDFDRFVKQIEAYHEGIDYCTKKLDVIKKETDSVSVKIDKAASQINPITRGAVVVLMGVSALIGAVVAKIFF